MHGEPVRNCTTLFNVAGFPLTIAMICFRGICGTLLLCGSALSQAAEVTIDVQADRVVGPVSRLLTGACIEDVNHEIYGGLYSQMVFGESFQEPAPSPTVAGFKAYGGHWVVQGGVVSIDGQDGPKLVSDHTAFSDGAVGVELRFADRAGDNAGLIVRASRSGIGADRFTGYEVSLDPARQTVRLARHRHNFEPIADVPCEVAVGRWIPLEVKLAGTVLEIWVDGRRILRHDDGPNALPAGTVGLRAWRRAASYRNLWVQTGGEREALAFALAGDSPEVSGMWRKLSHGEAQGRFALPTNNPFAGAQSQQVTFESGQGEWGLENRGLNRWGLNFIAGKTYEGCVWARAEKPTPLFVALESGDGSRVYAEKALAVGTNGWQRLDFKLKPKAADQAGRFALKLKAPGSVTLGHAFLQPGEWGRFKGLPVRRDVAEGLVDQGITVLRYGGSMVNHAGYRWKNMVGPRDLRPPSAGLWYRYSSNGWGIPDFMNFCEAAGFDYIPAFNMDETPQDMADFAEYARGSADSRWGRQRAADGRTRPYGLRYLELGNEERVDEKYADKFEALAGALWAKAPGLILVVGDFAYGQRIQDPMKFSGADSRITSLTAHRRILRFAKAHNGEVWFDVHVNTDRPEARNATLEGMFSFTDALARIADGARHKVVVFEFNAGNHAQRRALANALAVNAIERDGRIPIVTSANGLQPDGQNDNGWDQGLLFLNPAAVWLQPPGYVTRMLARNHLPQLVQCQVTGAEASRLDANAKRSDNGKTLVLQVVNPGEAAVNAQIHLAGFVPRKTVAQVTELAGALEAVNTAGSPDAMVPQQTQWRHKLEREIASRVFPPHSFTVLRFE